MTCRLGRVRTVFLTLCLSSAAVLALAFCMESPSTSLGPDAETPAVAGGVKLSPGYTKTTMPGQQVVYTHIITNSGATANTYVLVASSGQDWPLALFGLAHSGAETLPIQLLEGTTATVGLSVTVPGDVLSGTVDQTSITAASWGTVTVGSTSTDTIIACRVPGVVLSPGHSRSASPGEHITITHRITNTGALTDSFVVEARSQTGWSVHLMGYSGLTETLQITLGELDMYSFAVDVAIPLEAPHDIADQLVITATSTSSDAVSTTISDIITVRPAETYTAFLPVIVSTRPPSVKFGADFGMMITISDVITHDLPLVKEMGTDWIRVSLIWYKVEESAGDYQWTQYDRVFNRLRDLGLRAVVVVHGAPLWAAEESCGPISDTLALENFLERAMTRYGDVTDVWEFINEPDGRAPQPQYPQGVMGCWGPYPAEYAQQLAVFHAKARSLDAGALVAFGGLAYDAWDRFDRSFFSRTLKAGAGEFFDVANLHYYPINMDEFPTMAHKVNEIHDTMTKNGVRDKRIWVTETGMWVNHWGSVGQQRQFIVKEFTRGFGAGADNVFWFDPREHYVGEGVHRWLISEHHEAINGYDTFQHFSGKLEGLHCEGAYPEVPDSVEAYEFSDSRRSLYVLWSNTTTQTVTFPASGDVLLTDRDGETTRTVPVQDGEVTFDLGIQPMFLELVQDGAHGQ